MALICPDVFLSVGRRDDRPH